MIFFFLFYLSKGLKGNVLITSRDHFYELCNYGMLNAKVSIVVEGKGNLSDVILLIAPARYTNSARKEADISKQLCDGRYYITDNLSTNVSLQDGIFKWNHNLASNHNPPVYSFNVLNCKEHTFQVKYSVYNVDNYLDTRFRLLPSFYLSLTFFYSFLAVVWFINGLIHWRFSINLHTMLAVCPALQAATTLFQSKIWITRMKTDDEPISNLIIPGIVTIVANTFLFVINGLAVMGWNIYRYSVTPREIANLFSIVFMYFISRTLVDVPIVSSIYHLPVYFSLIIIGMFYAQFVTNSILAAVNVETNLSYMANDSIQCKLMLVIRFGMAFALCMMVVIFLILYMLVIDPPVASSLVVEGGFYLTVTVLDAVFFLLRNSYGSPIELVDSEAPAVSSKNSTITIINQPIGQEMSFVTQN